MNLQSPILLQYPSYIRCLIIRTGLTRVIRQAELEDGRTSDGIVIGNACVVSRNDDVDSAYKLCRNGGAHG
jgi:hypothetical protein